jgi:hypothetical protein
LSAQWYETHKTGSRGASNTYSEATLICAHMIGYFYHLTLRATQGFLQSLFHLWSLDLVVPCYTTLSRRLKSLQLSLMHWAGGDALHLILDSTGLKVFGEGEWKVRTHGVGKRRTWRKMHIGIEGETQEIICAVITTNDQNCFAVLKMTVRKVFFKKSGGERGIRTLGTLKKIQRFSRPPRSTTLAPLRGRQVA